jgi:FAD/FMN-containing dehydrogenase
MDRVERPRSVPEIQKLLKDCHKRGKNVSICGSRHATGGQQFATGGVLLDTRDLNCFIGIDMKAGVVTVGSGIEWPELIHGYLNAQNNQPTWGIRQKQAAQTE